MSSWEGRSKGHKSGYQVFVWILQKFGVAPAYGLLRVVAFYYFLFSFKASRNLYRLYRQRLGCSWLGSIINIYRNYYNLGQSIIDKVVIMSGIKNKFTFEFDGEDNLRAITALQKGGILISAHVGNWDIAGHLLKRLETTINIVIFDGEKEQIKNYLASVTGKKAVNFIIIKNDLSHIFEISTALKNNELVCMHADRFLEGNRTLSTPFLGAAARFPMGPFLLASTFKVPVSYVFALKDNARHYHLYASSILTHNNANKQEMMQQMLEDFAGEMTEKVKQYPTQWFNYFDFWA